MSADEERASQLRAAFGPERAPGPRPVPPPEHELARIDAAAGLVREMVGERCIHCASVPVVIAVWPGTGLARAMQQRHEAGCPDLA